MSKDFISKDKGFVIFDVRTKEYFIGFNHWDKQLRKAKIYHSEKWVDEETRKDIVARTNSSRYGKNPISFDDLVVKIVSIEVEK